MGEAFNTIKFFEETHCLNLQVGSKIESNQSNYGKTSIFCKLFGDGHCLNLQVGETNMPANQNKNECPG